MDTITITRAGRALALAGVVLPLLIVGAMKFTTVEAEGIRPLVSGTPWLAWMYGVFGVTGAARVIGAISMLLALPVWEPAAGGFPALNGLGQFLVKDIALLGICLTVFGERWQAFARRS